MNIRILDIRPVPPGAGRTIARFDLEIDGCIRLYGLILRELPDGSKRIAGPQESGRRFATFLPDIAEKIIEAIAIFEGPNAANRAVG